ncbi:MAG: hypothetical protein HC805_04125 [Alkalinema sp. RL_2_19]|nr:hypothetical protein [Alkalinema sp. RL_2_19]
MNQRSHRLLITLFGGAGVGLLIHIVTAPTLAARLLAIALLLLGLDQTRMAIVDLENIATVRQIPDCASQPQLTRFDWMTRSTIAFELIGFYVSSQWLAWGCICVLLSQVWFNLLAGVQLLPTTEQPIQPFGIRDRAVILVADSLGIGLASGYAAEIQPCGMAIGLLSMVCLYGMIKYWPIIPKLPIHSENTSKT